MSNLLFKNIYTVFKMSREQQQSPLELLKPLYNELDAIFPISFEQFIERLELGDPEFLERLYDKVLHCTQLVTNKLKTSTIHKSLALEQVRIDAYLLMQKRIVDRHPFVNSAVFGGYIYTVCENKCKEFLRKSKIVVTRQWTRKRKEEVAPTTILQKVGNGEGVYTMSILSPVAMVHLSMVLNYFRHSTHQYLLYPVMVLS